jgi:hypothetical protein
MPNSGAKRLIDESLKRFDDLNRMDRRRRLLTVLQTVVWYMIYDIFLNCSWVDTRWQQYSTHLHTNSTQDNITIQNTQNITYIIITIKYILYSIKQKRTKHTKHVTKQTKRTTLPSKHGNPSVRVAGKCPEFGGKEVNNANRNACCAAPYV